MNSTPPLDHQVHDFVIGLDLELLVRLALLGVLLAASAAAPRRPSSACSLGSAPPASCAASSACSASLTCSRHWTLVARARAKQTPSAAMPISAPLYGIRLPKNRIRKNDAAGISGMM